MKWTFEEDYIVCNFYLSHIDSWYQNIDDVMMELKQKGFGSREESSVIMRIQNFAYLHTGKGLSRAAKQSRNVYDMFIKRAQNTRQYNNLKSYIREHYIRTDKDEKEITSVVKDFTDNSQNTHDFIYTKPLGPSFQDVLFDFIDERGMKDSEVYNACFVGRDTFSHIRKGDKGVSKRTIRQLCFGLKLTYDEAVMLMESAGYAFSNNNITDVIVAYYLKNNIYDIFDVNATLYENQAELLFAI